MEISWLMATALAYTSSCEERPKVNLLPLTRLFSRMAGIITLVSCDSGTSIGPPAKIHISFSERVRHLDSVINERRG